MMFFAAVIMALVAIPCLYLGSLGLLALLPPVRRAKTSGRGHAFAVIIPAHNEAPRIAAAVQSVLSQDGGASVTVIVVADNCTDDTVSLAVAAGAVVITRTSATEVGKGYALAAGLLQLPVDASVVGFMDGDCTMTSNTLSAVSDTIASGERAVQCRYRMHSNPASPAEATRALALALVHVVRPLAKDRIGASAGLKGSGMFFERSVIDAAGWSKHGLAEDIEQHIETLRAGVRVAYVHEAVVTGEAPQRLADATTQHERWEAGRLSAARSLGPSLLATGLRRRSLPMIDAAIELLLPPLSVVGLGLVAATIVVVLFGGVAAITFCALAWGALLAYLLAGVARSELPPTALLKAALFALPFAAWKVALYARALVTRPKSWTATRRDS